MSPPADPQPRWPGPPQPLHLCCSGGADSVALLRLTLADPAYRAELEIVHFHHHLRPEADAEAEFVRALCARHNLPCRVIGLHPDPAAPNLQARARRLRHEALARLQANSGELRPILLAHHRDDRAETVLWNLLRGAGSRGLGAMRPISQHPAHPHGLQFWRPLLHESAAALRAWLRSIGQPWCEDASNADRKYRRNRLRHDALPFLSDRLGREISAPLARSAEILATEDDLLHQLARDRYLALIAAACAPAASAPAAASFPPPLPCRPFLAEPPALRRRILALWLADRGVLVQDFEAIERIEALAAAVDTPGGSPARMQLPRGITVFRQAGRLHLSCPGG